MSTHTDALRDIAANHGWPVCDEAADELEANEKAYGLLFAENAKLRSLIELIFASTLPYNDGEPTFSDEVVRQWAALSPSTMDVTK